MTRIFYDCEFMEDGEVIELLSIGMVAEDGREFYAESSEADWSHANEWVYTNVLPHLAGPGPYWMTRKEIADELVTFVVTRSSGPTTGTTTGWRSVSCSAGWSIYRRDGRCSRWT
jgi:hypothetical protein